MLARIRSFTPAILLAAGLAGCAHPPAPVVYIPPPPPVGHPYQVMVQVPAPTSRHVHVTAVQQQDVQQAFNVIALKSALMVAALTCGQQDSYDKFMTTFQPHVFAEQQVMDAYFKRIGGYYGRAKEDDFVTLLANNQSVGGIGQGAMFCLNNTAEYKAVLALKTYNDLDNFVTDLPPDAPAVAAADPAVTPLAPQDGTVHIAVVQSSRHTRLVRSHSLKTEHLAQTHKHHVPASNPNLASNAGKPVAVAEMTTTKPLSATSVEQ